jgi:uncharacterized protein (DUF58 family)
MSASTLPTGKSRLSHVLTTDFCPWANRFVYWLKEPVGWFALATLISVMIGLYLSPMGWTLAVSLSAIMVTGIAWPWIAVRVTQCGLRPETESVHEDTACRMVVSVRNRIPIPVWGLAIEGYLDSQVGGEAKPTVGLACVPPLCYADYSVNVTPVLRGHYPITKPQICCSFPFGIWTARRELVELKSLTVWPKVYSVVGRLPLVGRTIADHGDGSRGGRSGDFVGVRAFRRGDSSKQVNWVASARSDSLIVTERGGPQSVEIEVLMDTRCQGGRESLARRVRLTASILLSLHQSRIPTQVTLGDRRFAFKLDAQGRRRILDALALVPADGVSCLWNHRVDAQSRTGTHARILVSGSENGDIRVRLDNPLGGRRAGGATREMVITPEENLGIQIASLWNEVRDADAA